MNHSTLPPPFRGLEGRALAGPVPAEFEAFYRQGVRYRTGSRVTTQELRARYLAWAKKNGAPALSFRALRRAMENVGHAQRTSNGVYYADATFADLVPGEPDNFPSPAPIPPTEACALLCQIDRVACELGALRSRLTRLSGERIFNHGTH